VVIPDPFCAIHCYRRISDTIATAGQPTSDQFQAIAAEGFEVVINLGLKDADYALLDEQGLVESLGLVYEPIPVLWERPTPQDFDRFTDCMSRYEGKNLFIHCAANKRVSVFVALYQIYKQGLPSEPILYDLATVWTPNEIWQSFIEQVLNCKGIKLKH
jgi:protein tyrosine phosphatase (PTP) superfamily phosphohydrolase (DUF442 family)